MAKYMGLKNMGNTCYLNAGLQMLIQNPDFCRVILDNRNTSENLKNMANFIDEYHNSEDRSIKPDKIKRIVEKKNKIFEGNGQQDSAEFIVALMEILSEDLKNESINEIFNIETNTTFKCKIKTCLNKVHITGKTPFLILPIPEVKPIPKDKPIPEDKTIDLTDCYRAFKAKRKLEGDDKYFCEKCNKKIIASETVEVSEWSNHLIIWLSRYSNENGKQTKNDKVIEIPQKWRHKFEIKGAVIQDGSLSGGHYFYISKNKDNEWIEYNDSSTSKITDDRAQDLLNMAYLFHYKK